MTRQPVLRTHTARGVANGRFGGSASIALPKIDLPLIYPNAPK